MGKIAAQFAIDIEDKAVKNACLDLLTRQARHNLKKTYFDGVPADKVPTKLPVSTMNDEQWTALVELWSSAKHKEKCAANKRNRDKVQFLQGTGSRSYCVHSNLLVQNEKYKDGGLDAIEFFKECHNSSKTGLSEFVKEGLVQMKAIVNEPAQEGHASKTPAEAVAQVSSRKFLQNVGLDTAVPKRSAKAIADARVQELEAQVQVEKQTNAEFREKFEALNKKVMDSEAEVERMKKQYEATNAALRRVFCLDNIG